jgi:FlaA1/EpsC-like NDP-sugar epimerase
MFDLLTEGSKKRTFDFVRTGQRPGEKLYEELISEDETPRTVDLERLLVVLPPDESTETPALRAAYVGPEGAGGKPVTKTWHSGKDKLMTKAEIVDYLKKHQVLAPFVQPGGNIDQVNA